MSMSNERPYFDPTQLDRSPSNLFNTNIKIDQRQSYSIISYFAIFQNSLTKFAESINIVILIKFNKLSNNFLQIDL